jgi:hypothetical protein
MKMRGFVRVTLCAFSFVAGVDCGCGYGRPSVINPRHLGGTDVDKFEGFKANLKMKCGEEFEEQFLAVQQVVVAHKDKRVLSYLFKGKWLENIITAEFFEAFAGQPVNLSNVGSMLSGAAVATFNFDSEWSRSLITRLAALFSTDASREGR